jgi:hypothetical protein
MEMPTRSTGLDPIVAEIIEAHAGTMVDPFFGSTRAASILPSRPPNLAAAARRACQGWPRLRGHPKGLALIGPSTVACLIGWAGGRWKPAHRATALTLITRPLSGARQIQWQHANAATRRARPNNREIQTAGLK